MSQKIRIEDLYKRYKKFVFEKNSSIPECSFKNILKGMHQCGPTRTCTNANAADPAWSLGKDLRHALGHRLAQSGIRLTGRKAHW